MVPDGRRPALDGLRCLAVYLVVAFHAGLGRFGGGHVGVDVFFVLSGYLVTGVLLREVSRPDGGGTIRFGRFYARRARRLLPAALAALLVTAVAYRVLASPLEVAEARRGFQAAAVYLTNWYLIDNATDYFAVDVTHSPILHFWSLAVEEQFYLLWPLLFAGLLLATRGLGRFRWHAVRLLVAAGAAASLLWAFSLRASDPGRAYYGTDTRAYQLLLGALLALTPGVIVRLRRLGPLNALATLAGCGALVAISVWGTRTGPTARGIAAAVVTVGLLAALETGRAGIGARVLSWRPIEHLGQISYGTYLWHWPVIVLLRLLDPELSPAVLAAASALVATGIASLSYQLLEHPFRSTRRLDRIAWPVAVAGLALSLLAGLLVFPRVLTPSRSAGTAAAVAIGRGPVQYTPVPAGHDAVALRAAGYGDAPRCLDVPLDDCIVVDGTAGTMVLMGDSNAQMWIPTFEAVARDHDLRLYVLLDDGCPWQRDFYRLSDEIQATCRAMKPPAYDVHLPKIRPDLLVLAGAVPWPGSNRGFLSGNELYEEIRRSTADSLEQLSALADRILVIEHIPRPHDDGFDPAACLATEAIIEACRFVPASGADWLEADLRRFDQASDVVSVADFDRLACPFLPICDAMADGVPVFWDGRHLSREWAAILGVEVGAYLVEQGLMPAGAG